MNILFFGDIVGNIGKQAIISHLPKLIKEFGADFVIANGENVSKGKGLTEKDCFDLLNSGIDVITLGNHYVSKQQIKDYIDDIDCLIRPANLKDFNKGRGSEIFDCNGFTIRVTNILCQGLMKEEVNSPYECLNEIVLKDEKSIHIVDLHGESTSEKKILAYCFDGKVSAVIGTHTHVQTNDDQVLENGTFFISDVGMCGAYNSIIGFEKNSVINKFINNSEDRFLIDDTDDELINGVYLNFDDDTLECVESEKINLIFRRK